MSIYSELNKCTYIYCDTQETSNCGKFIPDNVLYKCSLGSFGKCRITQKECHELSSKSCNFYNRA